MRIEFTTNPLFRLAAFDFEKQAGESLLISGSVNIVKTHVFYRRSFEEKGPPILTLNIFCNPQNNSLFHNP